jgi:4-oxalocrotonate tautomerase
MPVVTIQMAKGRTQEQKRALVEGITNTVMQTLKVDPDWVTILISELERENIARAGTLLSES